MYGYVFNAEQYKRYAYNIISEYLPNGVQESLLKHIGFLKKTECNKRKTDGNSNGVSKKVKHHDVDYDETPKKIEKVSYCVIFRML